MRKIGTILVICLLLVGFAFAGGIVTNGNQSADYFRLMNRNASTDVDAVYFNPAGLTSLNDGLNFYLSSQTIYQSRTITSDVPALKDDTFKGSTFAPVFPNFYVAYKTGNLAFGAGFIPIGGGGSAVFDDGIPSFAVPAAVLPDLLTANGIPTTDYSYDVAFEGSSTYLGGQAVVSYKINDMISVAGGARYFAATNTYKGHLKDIMVNPTYPAVGATGSMTSAPAFFTTVSGALAMGAVGATAGAAGLEPFISGDYADFADVTFANIIAYNSAFQATVDGVASGFAQLGIPFDPATMTPRVAQQYALGAAATYTENSAAMASYAAQTGDVEVDAKQTGSGFAPIFGLYLTPMENLAIALRYEGKAAMTLTNETKVDGSGLFPDEAETGADMPAMLGVGVALKATPSVRVVADMNYYFNSDVDWSGKEEYLVGGMEAGVGVEFALSESLLLSGGYLRTVNTGALKRYHTDLSHTIPSSTFGIGGRYNVNSNLYISFGLSNTFYDDLSNSGVDYRGIVIGNETYDKNSTAVAIGVGFSL
ncbi:OmpP1/FadL family transporter [Candidatus Neomarinimicrobiota bacterium]